MSENKVYAPWHVIETPLAFQVRDGFARRVCSIDTRQMHQKAMADLIAAAPKMFDKLIEIRKWMDGDVCGPWDARFVAEIDAIIVEVRGES